MVQKQEVEAGYSGRGQTGRRGWVIWQRIDRKQRLGTLAEDRQEVEAGYSGRG